MLETAVRQIIDAHHHFWDLDKNYHPWLCDSKPIAFRYGSYEAIRKNYSQADYLNDARHFQVQGSVYVETEWDSSDHEGEMKYVDALRQTQRLPTVAVAHVRLDDADVKKKLEYQQSFSFVRSVRHKPRANIRANETQPGGMMDSQWRQGFSALGALGLRFDLQTPWWHMHEATQLAKTFPNVPIIINHAGLPSNREEQAIQSWKKAMKAVSAVDQVTVKISGIGLPAHKWTAESNSQVVLSLIEMFGVNRCMFASNFPVDSLCASFDDIFIGFETIVKDFSEVEKDALFRTNANRIYDMGLL